MLLIQDTTELDYSHHHKQGMGRLSGEGRQGLKVHSTLCANTSGVPMGLIGQKVWAREKKHRSLEKEGHIKDVEKRESQRWIESLEKSQEALPEGVKGITVADREADIHKLLVRHKQLGADFIIRACQNRRSIELINRKGRKQPLWDAVRELPRKGKITIKLQRTPKRKKVRTAELSIRYGTVPLRPPESASAEEKKEKLTTQVILAEEENPPLGEEPVVWLLLTSLEVNSFSQSEKILELYSYRWLIERYHYTLKSGCNLEKLQLKRADRIERALETYSIVAWRLLWLIYSSRENPEQAATVALSEEECCSLRYIVNKDSIEEISVPSLGECVSSIASLGGFLGRKCDGEPGVKTLWRGMQRLKDIAWAWTTLWSGIIEPLMEQLEELGKILKVAYCLRC